MSDKEKAQDLLSVFMKKQAQAKKKEAEIKSPAKKKPEKSESKEQDQENKNDTPEEEEEMTEEEELEDAKKASRNKAGETDQTEMIKKLIIESIVKYSVLITLLVIFSFAVIKFGAAFVAAMNGLLYKALMSALGAK